MKKDFTRDYTTEIFRAYAAAGMPTYEEARERVYKTELANRDSMDAATAIAQAEIATEKRTPYLLDIMAAEKTLELLECGGKGVIAHAVKAVYCAYPKLEQADLVYDAFYQIVQSDPELSDPDLTKKRRSDIYIADLNTSIRRLAFNSKKSDGFNPHLTVCDEIEAWPGEPGLKQYEVMKSALGARRQPLILSISTAGYLDNGIYDELIKRSTAFLLGGDEARLLPFLYMIDDVEKWDSIEELKKANPNLGVSVSVDFYLEEIKIARNSLSKRAEFLCKYCNIKQNSAVAWLSYPDVDKISNEELSIEDFARCYCVAGIDASQTTDLTAASIVIEREEKLYVITQFFMPADRIERATEEEGVPYKTFVERGFITVSGDHFIDYHDIYNWLIMLLRQYKIRPLQVGYDRYSIQYLIQDLNKAGFHTDDVFQGTNLSPVLKEFEGIVKDRKIEIGQNQLLKSHFLNVAVQINSGDGRMKPVKIEPRKHIDGFMSVIDALTVRSKYYAKLAKQLKNDKRKEVKK